MPELPPSYDPFALSRRRCGKCLGSGWSKSGHHVCRCVFRRLEVEKTRCRDKWELLYLEALRFPDNFPRLPVPQSSWARITAR